MSEKGSPQICDGRPITGQQNLNKLFKGQRQQRVRERDGFKVPHSRSAWGRFFDRLLAARLRGE